MPAAWARYPRRTFGVISEAIAARLSHASHTVSALPGARGETLAGIIRRGIREVGDSPRDVVAYLADNGHPSVPASRVYDVIRRDGRAGSSHARK